MNRGAGRQGAAHPHGKTDLSPRSGGQQSIVPANVRDLSGGTSGTPGSAVVPGIRDDSSSGDQAGVIRYRFSHVDVRVGQHVLVRQSVGDQTSGSHRRLGADRAHGGPRRFSDQQVGDAGNHQIGLAGGVQVPVQIGPVLDQRTAGGVARETDAEANLPPLAGLEGAGCDDEGRGYVGALVVATGVAERDPPAALRVDGQAAGHVGGGDGDRIPDPYPGGPGQADVLVGDGVGDHLPLFGHRGPRLGELDVGCRHGGAHPIAARFHHLVAADVPHVLNDGAVGHEIVHRHCEAHAAGDARPRIQRAQRPGDSTAGGFVGPAVRGGLEGHMLDGHYVAQHHVGSSDGVAVVGVGQGVDQGIANAGPGMADRLDQVQRANVDCRLGGRIE